MSEDVEIDASGEEDHSIEAEVPPEVEVGALDDPPAEGTVYVNPFYRFMTVMSAGVVAVLGLTVMVISRSVKPPMPMQITIVAGLVTIVLFVWYLLGMRSGLTVRDDVVIIATKVRRVEVPTDQVEWIALDTSLLGVIQPAGRSLQLRTTDGASHRVIGALPTEARACAETVAELQGKFGSPDSANESRLDRIIQDHFGEGPIVEPASTDVDWDEKLRATRAAQAGLDEDDAVSSPPVDPDGQPSED